MSHSFSPEILSSSSYPVPGPEKGAIDGAVNSDVLLGGLTLKNQETFVEAERAKSKKNSSRASSARKRGRPRLLNKDDNAAERRRTQIRLAQRAYRSRKEATISSLNDRVSEIDSAVESMARSFASFHDKLINSELLESHPDLLRSLRGVAGKTVSLAQLSKREAIFSGEMSREEAAHGDSAMSMDESQLISSFGEHSAASQNSILTEDDVLGYLASYAAADASSRSKSSNKVKGSHIPPKGIAFPTHTFNLHMPLSSTPQASTDSFAHRLQRICWERGYQLLLDPFADPETLFRAFRFSFGSTSRERLLARFYRALSRGSNNNNSVPDFRDSQSGIYKTPSGGLVPPQIPKSAGSWPLQLAETLYSRRSIDGRLEYPGFDGEWLDANDVEDFLHEQGIAVDARSSFVDISNMHSDLFQKIMISGSFQETTASIPQQYGTFQEQSGVIDPRIFASTSTSSSNSIFSSDAGAMISMEGSSSFPTPDEGSPTNPAIIPPILPEESMNSGFANNFDNISLTFDVKRFIDRLVMKAVCLGWTPGYRKVDVEESLYHAVRFII